MSLKSPQKSLKSWTKQKWRTKSGKPSAKTGERYLPDKAIKSLSSSEYAATTRAKREGTKAGKQFVAQPKKVADKVKKFRANEGGIAMKKPMNEGMKALKKEAPDVAKKMGYNYGGMTKKKSGYMGGGMSKMNDMRKTGMFYGGMAKKKG
jgi:hypothetical protein